MSGLCGESLEFPSRDPAVTGKSFKESKVGFSTYNWGYAPLELRKNFLKNFPEKVTLSVCFEIFSQRKLEGLHTPVMDYTISADEPGYYFTSECSEAAKLGIPISGNVNTAGIAWDFGCVPLVPAPGKLISLRPDTRTGAAVLSGLSICLMKIPNRHRDFSVIHLKYVLCRKCLNCGIRVWLPLLKRLKMPGRTNCADAKMLC